MKTLKMVHKKKKIFIKRWVYVKISSPFSVYLQAWDTLNIFEASLWNCHWKPVIGTDYIYIYIYKFEK